MTTCPEWLDGLKLMTAHNQQKKDKMIIQDINDLSDEEQANLLADLQSQSNLNEIFTLTKKN